VPLERKDEDAGIEKIVRIGGERRGKKGVRIPVRVRGRWFMKSPVE
jgi:hypothetical protein